MPLDFSLDSDPVLSVAAPDRAAPLRQDVDGLSRGWATARVLRVDRRNRFATDPAAGGRRRIRLEPASDHAEELPETAVFLGRTDEGRHIWALPVEELPDDPAVASLRVTGADLVEGDGSLASQALALLGWHRDTVRGREPQHHPRRVDAGWAIEDPFHGGPEYPRTDPAVICLVHDGGRRVLLARQPVWPAGMYSHVAGFVEAGESLEGCVRREVKEEVGVEVDRVRYLGSQPWPFPRSLMVGFHAVGDPDAPIVLEDEEISEAAWFDVDEVRAALDGRGDLMVAPPVSIAHVMLRSWVAAVDR
ncbi:MAG: NAD(+) diphosphatase [Dietzia sp.]|uniref:NAD(+) diphosphatase n=2 Tax=Dietzia TaxID=37914 RepID=A0ABP4UHL7_9ACTN|nr:MULTISPECIES: NAD(+) diphosphatase [Dietzia]MBB1035872.1 NAD(+) diphosphatase [Dietzia sp. CQ4]MBB1037572.1 NAD(+) diphosphatase [Dietzia natronolimnaea]MBB1047692.1 NAD(+) diphosphatase [Dietzia cercidiphylli]MBB1054915.1 NAD(+) diphosphatase [Dietzia sp. B44]MBC7295226.1 NAD(+) diphosphatase [Dietzia sp.]